MSFGKPVLSTTGRTTPSCTQPLQICCLPFDDGVLPALSQLRREVRTHATDEVAPEDEGGFLAGADDDDDGCRTDDGDDVGGDLEGARLDAALNDNSRWVGRARGKNADDDIELDATLQQLRFGEWGNFVKINILRRATRTSSIRGAAGGFYAASFFVVEPINAVDDTNRRGTPGPARRIRPRRGLCQQYVTEGRPGQEEEAHRPPSASPIWTSAGRRLHQQPRRRRRNRAARTRSRWARRRCSGCMPARRPGAAADRRN